MAAEDKDLNRDPITDEPGAHPVGTGIGAPGGAVAQEFRGGEPTGNHFGPGSDIGTRINVEALGTPWDTATSVPTAST